MGRMKLMCNNCVKYGCSENLFTVVIKSCLGFPPVHDHIAD
jgi:hypothetical protein